MSSLARVLHIVPSPEPTHAPSGVYPRAKLVSRTAQPASREDSDLSALATSLLVDALEATGLKQADLAAIWNCSEGRVRAKLDPTNDGAPITVPNMLSLERRAPLTFDRWVLSLVARRAGAA